MVLKQALGCQNSSGERERAEVLSRFHRPRRQVENPSGFQAGKIASCASGGVILRRESHCSVQKLARMAGDSEFCGFCNFAKGETVTAQIENLRRGALQGRYFPVRQLVKKPSKEGRLRKVAVAVAAGKK